MTAALPSTSILERISQTDTLSTAEVYEWLRLEDGVDGASVQALISASLSEVEGLAGQTLYPSIWKYTEENVERLSSSYFISNVRYRPQNLEVVYFVNQTRTVATISGSSWSHYGKHLTINISDSIVELDPGTVEIQWSDLGIGDSVNSINVARKLLIATHYDDGETMIGGTPAPYGVMSLIQPYMRVL